MYHYFQMTSFSIHKTQENWFKLLYLITEFSQESRERESWGEMGRWTGKGERRAHGKGRKKQGEKPVAPPCRKHQTPSATRTVGGLTQLTEAALDGSFTECILWAKNCFMYFWWAWGIFDLPSWDSHTEQSKHLRPQGPESLCALTPAPEALFVQRWLKEELGLKVKDKQGLFGFGFGLFAFVSFCLLT